MLTPRQPLNPVPYAVHAESSIHADIVDGLDAGTRTSYLSILGAAFEGIQYNMTCDNG
jgi:hypothetical protein